MWTVYTPEGMTLEEEIKDPETGETIIQTVDVPETVLENLKGTVKVDITPKSAFDKYATELTLENLLKGGYFAPEMVSQLRIYAEALPDDATAPKQKLLDICDKTEEEQRRIAEINAQAQLMQQRANSFLSSDPDTQADTILDAQQQLQTEEGTEEVPTEEAPVEM